MYGHRSGVRAALCRRSGAALAALWRRSGAAGGCESAVPHRMLGAPTTCSANTVQNNALDRAAHVGAPSRTTHETRLQVAPQTQPASAWGVKGCMPLTKCSRQLPLRACVSPCVAFARCVVRAEAGSWDSQPGAQQSSETRVEHGNSGCQANAHHRNCRMYDWRA